MYITHGKRLSLQTSVCIETPLHWLCTLSSHWYLKQSNAFHSSDSVHVLYNAVLSFSVKFVTKNTKTIVLILIFSCFCYAFYLCDFLYTEYVTAFLSVVHLSDWIPNTQDTHYYYCYISYSCFSLCLYNSLLILFESK